MMIKPWYFQKPWICIDLAQRCLKDNVSHNITTITANSQQSIVNSEQQTANSSIHNCPFFSWAYCSICCCFPKSTTCSSVAELSSLNIFFRFLFFRHPYATFTLMVIAGAKHDYSCRDRECLVLKSGLFLNQDHTIAVNRSVLLFYGMFMIMLLFS